MVRLSTSLLAALGLVADRTLAALPDVDVDDYAAAALVAEDLLTFYPISTPGWVPGILPGPPPDGDYYWWQGGAMWGALMDYRAHTDDDTYDDTISTAMLWQVGPDKDFMPVNWSASMGNDDQAFWALSAMLAAETGFPDPPEDQAQWLALAQAVFNEQTQPERRVDSGTCEWGLRWQVFSTNNGYNYINTIANACYFNIGTRLARYLDNTTYSDLADRTFTLIHDLGYISDAWDVYDGAHLPNCSDINKAQFSYNAALLIQGCAFMYNYTEGAEPKWKTRLDGLLDRSLEVFFKDSVAFEPSCEPGNCNTDMESFKGYLHRWLGSTAQLAPYTADKIIPVLKKSAAAAVKQCTGGDNGRFCGFHWSTGTFDGAIGAGQQMNVLGALTSIMTQHNPVPLSNSTGGTSQGDFNAGSDETSLPTFRDLTTGDRAGAGILTALMIAGACSAFAWMGLD
ncbi:putative glycoside hydrolase family 76 protein [Eutypa lata UCREL1]|uniref:Mannan endo-1,6-alpha-mannosidase n=1 Tax=Eutypa lata (strain UCR-EL1) TaxID=1287681 RepID=M7T6B4_EUTLA|nr:putative glycoside hydrolase family 76 protein [Eutypa lata UCREL1]